MLWYRRTVLLEKSFHAFSWTLACLFNLTLSTLGTRLSQFLFWASGTQGKLYHEKRKRRQTIPSSRDLLLTVMVIFSRQLSQNSQSSKRIKGTVQKKLMNGFHPSQNNGAKQSITPSQGTQNWLFLSNVKIIFVSTSQLQILQEVLEFSLQRRFKIRAFFAESQLFKIRPMWMSFPSKARILVLFKKRFLLKKTINRKLQRQKVSKFTKF